MNKPPTSPIFICGNQARAKGGGGSRPLPESPPLWRRERESPRSSTCILFSPAAHVLRFSSNHGGKAAQRSVELTGPWSEGCHRSIRRFTELAVGVSLFRFNLQYSTGKLGPCQEQKNRAPKSARLFCVLSCIHICSCSQPTRGADHFSGGRGQHTTACIGVSAARSWPPHRSPSAKSFPCAKADYQVCHMRHLISLQMHHKHAHTCVAACSGGVCSQVG